MAGLSDPFLAPALGAALSQWLGQLAALEGAAANTIEAYRRDVVRYLKFLSVHRGGAEGLAAVARTSQSDLRAWMAELYPDLEAEKAWHAAGVARVLARHGLDYLPTKKLIGWDVWYAQVTQASPEDPALIRNEMRRRYCAAFDCVSGAAAD